MKGADFTTNLYIQIVYTIVKFCTLLKKIVHFTILSKQEWAPCNQDFARLTPG